MINNENKTTVYNMVGAITTLAMLNSEVLHIDVKYTAFLKEIEVKVFDERTDYSIGYKRKFSYAVYLDSHNVLNLLKALEMELIGLVAESKSKNLKIKTH